MKKVVNKKVYNTDAAECVAEWWYGTSKRDFHFCHEALYRTKKGSWFLAGEGGPLSKYAENCGTNETSGGKELIPFAPDEAMRWLEEHNEVEALEQHFAALLREA